MKTKEIIKLIEQDGWHEVRQRGSHRQYKHSVKKGLVTILFTACRMIYRRDWKKVF